MTNSPRLLLLSDEGPQTSTAGGLLLYRLLEDFPADRLNVLERRVDPGRTRLSCRYQTLTTPWRRFEQSRFHRWKRSLRAFGLVPPVPLNQVDGLLEGFQPDLVLTVMQHACYYDAAYQFARSRGLPLVVIVHDVNEQFEPVLPWALAAARRRDGEFYRYATRRLCISPEMEALCAESYGVRGNVLYPNRSVELRPRPFEESKTLKTPGRLTVGFVGNLNYGYGDELVRLLPAFRASESRLVVFSNPPKGSAARLLEAGDCVDFRGFAPAMEAWGGIQSECDAVILPYPNPAGALERLYRHHFPSKLPEYLALGMPVIVSGPDYATGVKWAHQNPEAAVAVTQQDPVEFGACLSVLRNMGGLRLGLAREGFAAGSRDFDPYLIKQQFCRHILESAGID